MNGVLAITVVEEANNCLSAAGYDDGRTRRATVVANKTSRLQLRKHLLGEWTNLEFIIPDLFACDGIDDLPGNSMSVSLHRFQL